MRARHPRYDPSKLRLPEQAAIQDYMEWKKYREAEGHEAFATFAEWLECFQIQILPPQREKNPGERGVLSHAAQR